jgi:hypothetical protein
MGSGCDTENASSAVLIWSAGFGRDSSQEKEIWTPRSRAAANKEKSN